MIQHSVPWCLKAKVLLGKESFAVTAPSCLQTSLQEFRCCIFLWTFVHAGGKKVMQMGQGFFTKALKRSDRSSRGTKKKSLKRILAPLKIEQISIWPFQRGQSTLFHRPFCDLEKCRLNCTHQQTLHTFGLRDFGTQRLKDAGPPRGEKEMLYNGVERDGSGTYWCFIENKSIFLCCKSHCMMWGNLMTWMFQGLKHKSCHIEEGCKKKVPDIFNMFEAFLHRSC